MKTFLFLWLPMVVYTVTAAWAIDTYWKHDVRMKIIVSAPMVVVVVCGLLHILFEDQIWRLRHSFSRWRARRRGPPQPRDMVTVHLRNDRLLDEGDDRWDVYQLQEQLRTVLKRDKTGVFDGNEFAEEEAVLFMFGPDGEMVFKSIEPVLKACPLCSGAIVRIAGIGHNLAEREIHLE